MKKTFTLVMAAALCASVNAQELKFLSLGLGTPGVDEPPIIGLGISSNGKYVCGSLDMGYGYFVGNLETNVFEFATTEDPEGAELRHIDNNGLAIGFDGPGITFSIEGGCNELEVPDDSYKYILGEDLSNDGSIMVGSLIGLGYSTFAAVSRDGGTWTPLPMPSDEILGEYAGAGSAAKYCSGDGKVILGYIGSWGPATLWLMNDDGEYEVLPLFNKICVMTEEDEADDSKQFLSMMPMNISENGKLVLLRGFVKGIDYPVAGVYNIETEEVTIYSEPQDIDEYGLGLTPSAIANDGTIVGVVGQPAMGTCAFIINAGEEQAETFANEFAEYSEIFYYPDLMGWNIPTDISADGRYILGYLYYCDNFDDPDADAYFRTYVIDTDPSGEVSVDSINTGSVANQEAIYTIDGRRINDIQEGINIIRMSDGTTRKVIKK